MKPKLDMGTTVTGALVNSKYKFILIFNIGDSRTYILDNSDQIISGNSWSQLLKSINFWWHFWARSLKKAQIDFH